MYFPPGSTAICFNAFKHSALRCGFGNGLREWSKGQYNCSNTYKLTNTENIIIQDTVYAQTHQQIMSNNIRFKRLYLSCAGLLWPAHVDLILMNLCCYICTWLFLRCLSLSWRKKTPSHRTSVQLLTSHYGSWKEHNTHIMHHFRNGQEPQMWIFQS